MFRDASQPHPLARFEGDALYAAADAILKGLLEAETTVSLLAGPRLEPFDAVFRSAAEEGAADVLRGHELRLVSTPTAARGVTLAVQAACFGRGAVALVPNTALADAMGALRRATELARDGSLCVLFEDRPSVNPETCPLRLAQQLDMPCIAPADLAQLRDALDSVFRVSRAGRCPVAIVVHGDLLRSVQTIEARPNRVIESVDAMLARRRHGRRPRVAETGDVLRIVRRLEFNRGSSLPSPGERTPIGFITVGTAAPALAHLTHALRLVGRVPTLQLGAVHPIDGAAVSRLLSRCEQVVVLESRPGTVEAGILDVAEHMRSAGERPGIVWGRTLPANAGPTVRGSERARQAGENAEAKGGSQAGLAVDAAIHPSRLARATVHLLHRIRPGGQIAGRLLADRPFGGTPHAPERGATVGAPAALALVRRLAADVDQWLHDREATEEGATPTALAIDGAVPESTSRRLVMVETWDSVRFQREGIGAIRQAARDEASWIFIICDVGSEDEQDLERLARGVIPAERADRVRIETANLATATRLVEVMREAALSDGMTIIVVRDGPPAVCDVGAIERALGEIDRLGYEPRQRMTWPADRACAIRQLLEAEFGDERSSLDGPPMRSEVTVGGLPRRGRGYVRLRTRPLLEQIEVERTRPPARRWRRDPSSKLPLPEVLHGQAGHWRGHVAGFGGPIPGWTVRIIAHAGRLMGYRVSVLFDSCPIGAGRRAWGQVLFTRPRGGEAPQPLTTRIPFGEADLLLGVDALETLRAIADDTTLRVAHHDRTYAVVNAGRFNDESDTEQARALRTRLTEEAKETTRPEPRVLEDFAGACRAWFHTDRVVNVALLGAAFQSGMIPVSIDALTSAVASAERAGFRRATEAFQFGRHLIVDRRLFSRPKDDREEDVGRIVRRMVHLLSRRRGRARRAGAALGRLIETSLEAMPGLTETDPGRQARRDFVIALYRCYYWGGIEYAEQFATLVTGLYAADRGDSGRALTRAAVLPVASAMLIRDAFFVASMATSGEQRRRIRRALNVKRARDDRLKRRYLTRFELIVLGHRYRADLRTSDWPARVAAAACHLVARKWRGSRRERELRAYLFDLVDRAIRNADRHYEHFQTAFGRLHQQAVEDRLRGMAISEVRMLAEPGAESGDDGEAAGGP